MKSILVFLIAVLGIVASVWGAVWGVISVAKIDVSLVNATGVGAGLLAFLAMVAIVQVAHSALESLHSTK